MKRKIILISVIAITVLIAAIIIGISLPNEQKLESFTVTFQDYDGTVLKTEDVKAGGSATAPDAPKREGYTFSGWNKELKIITKDTIVVAEYILITNTTFTVDTINVEQGTDTVEVKVSVTNNPGILGMVFSASYDEEVLKLIDCQNGKALSALAFQEPSRFISGCNFVWYGSETGEIMDGEMLILTFEIAENAKPGTYPVSISWENKAIFDSNSDMVAPDVTPGAIIIS